MNMFSNPLLPIGLEDDHMEDVHPLKNEDFRKMLMTPHGASNVLTATISQAKRRAEFKVDKEEDAATMRKKKKSYYAKLQRDKEERQKELALKYRDRARERRDGQNRDEPEQMSTRDYTAVAPDAKSVQNYAEQRRKLIEESKYLGGDMKHTHLVKGLDYALLDKVRAEISTKEKEEEDKMEMAVTQNKEEEDPEEKIEFKTKLGYNIYHTLFKNKIPPHNKLFLPKRMAYAVDLEGGDFDIPSTIIRSKADSPSLENTAKLTTQDLVINKVIQIFSDLRLGKRELQEKGKQKEDDKPKVKPVGADESIYGEMGECMPCFAKPEGKKKCGHKDCDRRREHKRDRHDYGHDQERGRDRKEQAQKKKPARKPYFEKPAEEEEDKDKPEQTAKDLVRSINDRFKIYADIEEEKKRAATKAKEERLKKLKAKTEIDSYAECYPGMMESADAIDDSDEEADFTKRDHGIKKGSVGRWDFDTQEEYSSYMSRREALPKAALQYGRKMSDGRKSRRVGPKLQTEQIHRIIEKLNAGDSRKHNN